MATIPRKTQKIFASGVAATNNVAQFGSLKAGTPNYSSDPDVIQALAAFTNGWAGAVVGTNSPAIQDENALWLLVTQQLAYLLQRGIPEYDTATEYGVNCFCSSSGSVYRSLQSSNTGHSLGDTNWWALWPDVTPAVATSVVPTGGMVPFALASAPSGWLLCDGTVYNIADYPALGNSLGATYGGNGTSTFAVPDLRGRTPVGSGTGTASDATNWTLGQKRGTEGVSLTADQNGAHTHDIVVNASSEDSGDPGNYAITAARDFYGQRNVGTTTRSGLGLAHSNVQPSLAINYIIKT